MQGERRRRSFRRPLLLDPGGELEVDVLERGPPDLEPLERDSALERPAGEPVQDHRPGRRPSAPGSRPRAAARGRARPAGRRRRRPPGSRKLTFAGRLLAVADLARPPGGDDPAAGDDRHPVREPLRLVHVVGGQEDGLAELAQTRRSPPRPGGGRRVEAGRRLVEEEQLGVADQRDADVETAQLAAREAPRPGVRPCARARPGRSSRRRRAVASSSRRRARASRAR